MATVSVATVSSLFVGNVYAAEDPRNWLTGVTAGGTGDVPTLIKTIINWAIGFAAIVAVIMLIVAGYMYITANGDEGKIGKATKTLTFAIVGLVICFIAVILVNFVLGFLFIK